MQEGEEPLHEGDGARGGLLTHGAAHGSRERRRVQCSTHAARSASPTAGVDLAPRRAAETLPLELLERLAAMTPGPERSC